MRSVWIDGLDGIGRVGIEYSFGNAYADPEGDFLCCRDDNNRLFSNDIGLSPPVAETESSELAGEEPRIFESNYSSAPVSGVIAHKREGDYLLILSFCSSSITFDWTVFYGSINQLCPYSFSGRISNR